MGKFIVHLSGVACFAWLALVSDAVAVPVVKKLGTGSTYSGTANAVAAKTGAVTKAGSAGRTGVLRSLGSGKSIAITKPKATATGSDNAARLSVGKYLHAGGISTNRIQPSAVIPSDSGINSRITELENRINDKADKADLNNYYTKTEVEQQYTTQQEKEIMHTRITELQNRIDSITNGDYADDWATQGPVF